MTVTPHLDQIERKYRSLKDKIYEARQHPSIDDLELAELKRRKLQLKDELEKLRQEERKNLALTLHHPSVAVIAPRAAWAAARRAIGKR